MNRDDLDNGLHFEFQSPSPTNSGSMLQAPQRKARGTMNGLAWIAQIILAFCFLFTGFGKLLTFDRLMSAMEARSKRRPAGVSRRLAAFIGIAEVTGALGVVTPAALLPAELASGHLLVRMAAAGLALIMVLAGIYHLRRNEEAAPAVTLFFLAVFVILLRWPR
jgi:uncharacterized membrane protein YphA (DoxX/SURF4 family)